MKTSFRIHGFRKSGFGRSLNEARRVRMVGKEGIKDLRMVDCGWGQNILLKVDQGGGGIYWK